MSEYKNILSRAAKLCSAGEKCSSDIEEKMTKWGMAPEDTEKAIKYLVENNFLNDARYAEFFTKDKFRFNKWGRIKIAHALRQKQISSELIESAINEIDPLEYFEILDQIIRAKIRSVGNMKIINNKAKVLRFAAQKGFTSEEIFASISRIEKQQADD